MDGSAHKIHLVAAARPNFMKVAPVYHALKREPWCDVKLIHTGQHYDANMSDTFFKDLELPLPHYHLGVGSGMHAEQTAGVMMAYERICCECRPDWIIVVGDVNSTMACALVGSKLRIPVAHLEAGLRSHDRSMPEEINRIVTDAVANLLWTPSPDADQNLVHEGIPQNRIDRVGNIMIDSYEFLRNRIERDGTRQGLDLEADSYGLLTLHRPSNVDTRETLVIIVDQIRRVARDIPLVFTVHPRTRKQLHVFKLMDELESTPGLKIIEPLSYIQFMNLVRHARVIITDSGGVQEETTYLNIPCLTLRNTTERPITVTQGSNKLVRPEVLLDNVRAVLGGDWPGSVCPELWDGNTASRVIDSLRARIAR